MIQEIQLLAISNFKCQGKGNGKKILLGITGDDWVEKDDRLIAWEIKILGEDDKDFKLQ